MKIITVIGARPQFIKAATVSRRLNEKQIHEVIIHTGQHFDINMSDIFFRDMDIPKPDYFLNINGLSHGAMTGQMLEKIEDVLKKESPSLVLVYGDTNSTLAGAIAAAKLNIPVAHVEAGLRSFNMRMPEEVNRILTDRISSKLYCPTKNAVQNLEKEGFGSFGATVKLVGDVMLDAVLYYSDRANAVDTLKKFDLTPSGYFLATFHRAENTDNLNNLKAIVEALNTLCKKAKVIVPLHPRTKKVIASENISVNFNVVDPVGYFDMINLTRHAKCLLTDSGGLQKEAYFLQRFCVTMRDQTEWVELVKGGYNILAGANKEKIVEAIENFSDRKFKTNDNLYGDGKAASRIVEDIERA